MRRFGFLHRSRTVRFAVSPATPPVGGAGGFGTPGGDGGIGSGGSGGGSGVLVGVAVGVAVGLTVGVEVGLTVGVSVGVGVGGGGVGVGVGTGGHGGGRQPSNPGSVAVPACSRFSAISVPWKRVLSARTTERPRREHAALPVHPRAELHARSVREAPQQVAARLLHAVVGRVVGELHVLAAVPELHRHGRRYAALVYVAPVTLISVLAPFGTRIWITCAPLQSRPP